MGNVFNWGQHYESQRLVSGTISNPAIVTPGPNFIDWAAPAAFTMMIPSGFSNQTQRFEVINYNVCTNSVILSGQGTTLINGAATAKINLSGTYALATVSLYSGYSPSVANDGDKWIVTVQNNTNI